MPCSRWCRVEGEHGAALKQSARRERQRKPPPDAPTYLKCVGNEMTERSSVLAEYSILFLWGTAGRAIGGAPVEARRHYW